jgi:hypothetical protein
MLFDENGKFDKKEVNSEDFRLNWGKRLKLTTSFITGDKITDL